MFLVSNGAAGRAGDRRLDGFSHHRRQGLGGKLARLKLPRVIDFRAELPREANGKLYKRKLKEEYRAREPQDE